MAEVTTTSNLIRRTRFSTTASLIITFVAFVPLLAITWFVLFWIGWSIYTTAWHVLSASVAGILDYLLLRWIFLRVRWRRAAEDGTDWSDSYRLPISFAAKLGRIALVICLTALLFVSGLWAVSYTDVRVSTLSLGEQDLELVFSPGELHVYERYSPPQARSLPLSRRPYSMVGRLHLPLPTLAFVLAIAAGTCLMVSSIFRSRHRRRRGLCSSCGYDLTGNESGVCPECGEATT